MRFECLQAISDLVTDQIVVTTNGGASQEWHAYGPPEGQLQVKER